MSATKQVTIWCDGCPRWVQRADITATAMRGNLSREGWRVGIRGVLLGLADFCPDCPTSTVEAASDG